MRLGAIFLHREPPTEDRSHSDASEVIALNKAVSAIADATHAHLEDSKVVVVGQLCDWGWSAQVCDQRWHWSAPQMSMSW